MAKVSGKNKVTLFGDGSPTREFLHVDDLADAHLKALGQLKPSTNLQLNLGTGQGQSVLSVIEACRKVTGHPIPTTVEARRAGDPAELVADSSLAKKVLGWEPQYGDIESIVETAWRWHSSHPRGYSSLTTVAR